ncbi:protein kinase domain-containing protein [Paenibacillus sp. 1001270B_150601_E10]|uniref:protein kinase domain-containing protein n=1 Tax=Paenibacillus sp. 1001270B_150601_E10 TaxID=2787079 RepID=UPI0018A0B811|nr:serine/threonine protein kinase [Paenibacillus sp. 1001270B_150601_E10]
MTTSYKRPPSRKQDKKRRSVGLMPGDRVIGKWNSHIYRIVRLLGQGANGVVFLVHQERGSAPRLGKHQEAYALKIGYETLELQSEINALQALEALKPAKDAGRPVSISSRYLIEADDADIEGKQLPFYVMKYLPGKTLSKFILKNGNDWMGIIGEKLLQRLLHLHQHHVVFGDLKPDNVMIGTYGEVNLIDYGGLTKEGDSIRQFTEWYDRGYWNAGTRKADYCYDLFAYAVMVIHLLSKGLLHKKVASTLPQLREPGHLLKVAAECKALNPYQPWLRRAIYQNFSSTEEALKEWKQLSSRIVRTGASPSRPTPRWLRWSFIASALLLIISLIYMFFGSNVELGI